MNLNQLIPSMSSMPYLVRDIVGKVTNAVMNYTDAEVKVIEATNDDSWGPHGKLMEHIAELTFSVNTYNEVMSMLWRRILQDGRTNWRRVYKGCTLLTYLLKHGSHKVLHSAQDRLEELRMLEHVEYPNDGYRNTTKNVQLKLAEVLRLVEDSDAIESERTKARELKSKYVGVSSRDWSLSHQPESFYSGKNPPTDSYISGRWRSTNPGILDRITEVTERVKEFVIDSRNSFKSGSDNESSDGEYQQHSSSHSEINDVVQPTALENLSARQGKAPAADGFEDFADFQEAEGARVGSAAPAAPLSTQGQADLLNFDRSEGQTTLPKADTLEDLFQHKPTRSPISADASPTQTVLQDVDAVLASGGALLDTPDSTCIRNDNIFDCLMDIPAENTRVGGDVLLKPTDAFGSDLLLSIDDLTTQASSSGEPSRFEGPIVVAPCDKTANSQKVALDKLPNTWSDCLEDININLESFAIGQTRNRTKTPMGQMKLRGN